MFQKIRINFFGHTVEMMVDPSQPNHATILSFLRAGKPYEPDVTSFVLRVLRPGDGFLDVGANIGYFTLLASRVVGPEGSVRSYEPVADNLAQLDRHLEMNGCGNVSVVGKLVADRSGPSALYINSDNAGGNSMWDPGLFPGNTKSAAERRIVEVKATTLDEELEGQAPPKLIKIDVEGAEMLVLKGAERTLASGKVPFVICELSDFALNQMGHDSDQMRAYMSGYGYATFLLEVDGSLPRLIPPGTRITGRYIANLVFCRPEALAPYWPTFEFNPEK